MGQLVTAATELSGALPGEACAWATFAGKLPPGPPLDSGLASVTIRKCEVRVARCLELLFDFIDCSQVMHAALHHTAGYTYLQAIISTCFCT